MCKKVTMCYKMSLAPQFTSCGPRSPLRSPCPGARSHSYTCSSHSGSTPPPCSRNSTSCLLTRYQQVLGGSHGEKNCPCCVTVIMTFVLEYCMMSDRIPLHDLHDHSGCCPAHTCSSGSYSRTPSPHRMCLSRSI